MINNHGRTAVLEGFGIGATITALIVLAVLAVSAAAQQVLAL